MDLKIDGPTFKVQKKNNFVYLEHIFTFINTCSFMYFIDGPRTVNHYLNFFIDLENFILQKKYL